VLLPADAVAAADALRLADARMYQHKAGRPSVSRQVRTALVSALDERDQTLRAHADDVARLAVAVGAELGVAVDEQEDLRMAGELHDLGKLGIPEAILDKPGELSDDKWAFMRQHTVIGERILSSTPP
jgi:HD-GYP domain-containing protein (c-di-GMP phosphodiesterase class II)